MYCPECRVEYRDGFTQCSDCQVALVAGVAPEAPETSDSHLDPVLVFESNDLYAIALAKGLFDDSGIPFWMEGDETAARLVLSPIRFPSCRFLVPKDREMEARELLEPLEHPQG
jgi:hypothetical protein